jgi:hypothetical protein
MPSGPTLEAQQKLKLNSNNLDNVSSNNGVLTQKTDD